MIALSILQGGYVISDATVHSMGTASFYVLKVHLEVNSIIPTDFKQLNGAIDFAVKDSTEGMKYKILYSTAALHNID